MIASNYIFVVKKNVVQESMAALPFRGCHSTEDAQVVMSDTEKQVHAFVSILFLSCLVN